MSAPALTFTEASAELGDILRDLESDQLDVDDVVARVRRGAELIGVCRQRLTGAQLQVAQIVAELTDPSNAT